MAHQTIKTVQASFKKECPSNSSKRNKTSSSFYQAATPDHGICQSHTHQGNINVGYEDLTYQRGSPQ